MRPIDPRLLRRARPVRTLLALDVAAAVAGAVLLIAQATVVGRVVGDAFDGAVRALPWDAACLLVAIVVGRAVLAWGVEVAGRIASSRVLSDLRLELVRHRIERQPTALDAVETGELAAAIVQGGEGLATYFGRYLPQVALAAIIPAAVIGWSALIDLTSALVMLVTVPLVPVFMALVGTYTERSTRRRYATLRVLSSHFLDVVRGLPTLRAFNRGEAQAERIGDVTDRYRRATMETLRIAFLSGAVLELAATIGTAIVAVTLGIRLVDGGIGLTPALTVLMLTPELYAPLRAVGTQFHAAADGLAVAERIFDLLDAPGTVRAPGGLAPPDARPATIRFEDVAFAYPSRRGDVLDGVDLVLRPGEAVAIVGPSGVGKSTLISLILGLAEPTRGRIVVEALPTTAVGGTGGVATSHGREPDPVEPAASGAANLGTDLAAIDLVAWREQLAWLPQRPAIIRATVAENVRLADPSASDERVRAAAEMAGARSFIEALPRGYQTMLGESGRTLSAGERRRIALARAFLRDAGIVVLDEPTADLDPDSAALVVEAVERLRSGRTVLIVAHDERLAARADRVLRLEGGRLVEDLPHGIPRAAAPSGRGGPDRLSEPGNLGDPTAAGSGAAPARMAHPGGAR